MDIEAIEKTKLVLMQHSIECWSNCSKALNGYSRHKNATVSIQFMNQAYHCMIAAQMFYLQTCEIGEIQPFLDFHEKFHRLNDEFLTSVEQDHSLQHSFIYLDDLQEELKELKIYFNVK